jgi:hypothetical protein
MHFAFVLVEAIFYPCKERIVVALEFEKYGVGDMVGKLQHARIVCACRIRKVFGEVSDRTDFCAASSETSYPGSRSLMEASFGED